MTAASFLHPVFALAVWIPAIVWGLLFLVSYRTEPSQFRNAIFLLAFVIHAFMTVVFFLEPSWVALPLGAVLAVAPLVTAVSLVANTVVVCRREGVSVVSLLPLALAFMVVFPGVALVLALFSPLGPVAVSVLGLLASLDAWFSFSYVALLLYSWVYRQIPRDRVYDYIVVHGAGLMGDRPTPLLAGRLDRALELWERQGRVAKIVVSGGRGPDEAVSEASAMHRYLAEKGVPEDALIDEDRSTNTMENLMFSKAIMEGRSGRLAEGATWRCAVVTSDFHVFRCAEYARKLGIPADGVGSVTRGWYHPAAFTREFLAITKAHLAPYAVIAAVWAVACVAVAALLAA